MIKPEFRLIEIRQKYYEKLIEMASKFCCFEIDGNPSVENLIEDIAEGSCKVITKEEFKELQEVKEILG